MENSDDSVNDGSETKATPPPPTLLAPSAAVYLESVKERAIDFFSNASNETLGACLVGLGATTYIVLGRVGLVLIGVVGGIALHASWENSHNEGDGAEGAESTTRKKLKLERRNEMGIEVARRVLDWREKHPVTASEEPVADASDFGSFRPATAEALDVLMEAATNYYVKWWYSPILPDETKFPTSCRETLTKFVLSISSHLSRKRPADTLLDFVTNSSSIMIVFLNQLSQALAASPNISPPEAIEAYLEAKPDCSLAQIMDRKQQDKKLMLIATDILERHITGTVYRCLPVRIFLREMLASVAMEKTLDMCSKSDFINDWIIYLLEDGEPEIMNVIDDSIEHSVTEDGIVISEMHNGISRIPSAAQSGAGSSRRSEDLLNGTGDDDISDSTRGIPTPLSSFGDTAAATLDGASAKLACENGLKTMPDRLARATENFTLHRAAITIYDDSDTNDKRFYRSKPNVDFLIQVEPTSSYFAGWMIVRTYEDFERLHEVLRRIATISGVKFAELHPYLPHWRDLTKPHLRDELERYLVDALGHDGLAESEGMKRFLDKDLGMTSRPSTSSTRTPRWSDIAALESVGKGVVGAISGAPKGLAKGGKAVLGGVTGGISGVLNGSPLTDRRTVSKGSPLSRTSTSIDLQGSATSRRSVSPDAARPSIDSQSSMSSANEPVLSGRRDSATTYAQSTPGGKGLRHSSVPRMRLPPPPSSIADDYSTPLRRSVPATPLHEEQVSQMSADGTAFFDVPTPPSRSFTPPQTISSSTPALPPRPGPPVTPSPMTQLNTSTPLHNRTADSSRNSTPAPPSATTAKPPRTYAPLSEPETQVIVELLFAVITELYTLSSAWQIRLTLLTAAKSFLLRPGNPQLASIRTLLQTTVLDTNTSDAGLASMLYKLRENALPTEEETAKWEREQNRLSRRDKEREREEKRVKARKLLVERGMPPQLTSVMGAAASGEALGRVFDALQEQNVARGLAFGLLLQSVRVVVQ